MQTKENTTLSSKVIHVIFRGCNTLEYPWCKSKKSFYLCHKRWITFMPMLLLLHLISSLLRNSQLRMFSTPCILFSLQITTFIHSGIILWFKRIGHLWIDALLGLGWKTWISWMEPLRPLQEIKLLPVFRVYKYLWFKIVLRDIKRGSDISLFYLNL